MDPILAFLVSNPYYRYLIGPVSISRFYSDLSRKVLMEYAMRNLYHPEFAQWFQPRIPYDPELFLEGKGGESQGLSLPNLTDFIEGIRPEHIEFPVLMKQYIRQNAKFLGFNLDINFNNALDGLMILDLKDVPDRTLELLQREI